MRLGVVSVFFCCVLGIGLRAQAGELLLMDVDHDGIPTMADNCADDHNPDQADSDRDGVGDACEFSGARALLTNLQRSWKGHPDGDGDQVPDYIDNCPQLANPGQHNLDGDGLGDICDEDDDGDTVADMTDNCPRQFNTHQVDQDGNGLGEACERSDRDRDGIVAAVDNCPLFDNGDQSDLDLDGLGDLCDSDRDGDGVMNEQDNCPNMPNVLQIDLGGDGMGDICQ